MSALVVGVPTEIKDNENRVSMQPDGVAELVHHGHQVLVQAGAGDGSRFADDGVRRRRRQDRRHRRRGVRRRRPDRQGQGADPGGVPPLPRRVSSCSPTCTWPPTAG